MTLSEKRAHNREVFAGHWHFAYAVFVHRAAWYAMPDRLRDALTKAMGIFLCPYMETRMIDEKGDVHDVVEIHIEFGDLFTEADDLAKRIGWGGYRLSGEPRFTKHYHATEATP